MPTDTKKPWESKTILINTILALLGAVAVFVPGASALTTWIAANGATIALVWGILSIILRAVSKGAIVLTD